MLFYNSTLNSSPDNKEQNHNYLFTVFNVIGFKKIEIWKVDVG